jgi:hypothetical protein
MFAIVFYVLLSRIKMSFVSKHTNQVEKQNEKEIEKL